MFKKSTKTPLKSHQVKKPNTAKILQFSFGGIFLLLIISYLYISYLLPIPDSLILKNNYLSTKIYDRHGQLLYEVLNPDQGRKTYLKLDQMPKTFVQAVLASEDSDYYNHIGVDIPAIARAFFYNSLEQKVTSGASTITQQLVRNLMGTNRERTFGEKIIESVYAIRLSHLYSKEQVLEQYLNSVYFGNLSYGAASASLNYFGKNIYDLDLAEQTILAGLPQSPSNFNPLTNFSQAKNRQQYVLNRLKDLGQITEQQSLDAFNQPLHFRKNTTAIKSPHFVHHIIAELEQKYGEDAVTRGGLNVITTLDYDLQHKAEQIIQTQLNRLAQKHVTNAALISAQVKSGQILVWIGSSDYFNDNIDGQVDLITSLRQPGSALKPFLYLLALQNGSTLASIIADLPFKIQTPGGTYAPLNYDLDFHGPVRLREALANSFNIPAVKTLDQLKVENFLPFLQRLGLQTLNKSPQYYGLALTLGGGEVRLYDMVKAYSTLANYGKSHQLSDLLEVKSPTGETIEKWQPSIENQLLGAHGEQNAFLITNTLSDPNARLKSFGDGNVLELSFPAAVKTGTTRNFKDNWTFGYSTEILTGVWVGNADATAMEKISGIDGAGPIWHDFMEYYHQFQKPAQFPVPAGLNKIQICAISGLLPGQICPEQISEWFVKGTEPRQTDDYYQNFTCQNQSGQISQKVLVNYPQEYQKWAEERGFSAPSNCRTSQPVTPSTTGISPQAIQITSPLANDVFQIDPNIPLSAQKIPFKFLINQPTTQATIFLDNQIVSVIGQAEATSSPAQASPPPPPLSPDQSYFWLPTRGQHTLKIQITASDKQNIISPPLTFRVD